MNHFSISDITSASINSGGALLLPIRNEKSVTPFVFDGDVTLTPPADYAVVAALKPFTDYITIAIPGRGTETPNIYDPNALAVYHFLINPAEVNIERQTLDGQANTRGGWQNGVWGESFITVSLTGKTPGRYAATGVTDANAPYTRSHRNLVALELVFENNGYWWEGEQAYSSLSPTIRRIKQHQDVILTVGEFRWNGMFEALEVHEAADSPFLAEFHLSFTAWKETYNQNSPYPNPIGGETQAGHVPTAIGGDVQTYNPSLSDDSVVANLISNKAV